MVKATSEQEARGVKKIAVEGSVTAQLAEL